MRSVKGLNEDDVRAQLEKNKGLQDQVDAAAKSESERSWEHKKDHSDNNSSLSP